MTQEEKARAYDEALERARALRQEAIDKEYAIDYVKDYEAIFPELKESEDERIRKKIIENVRLSGGYTDEEIDEMISWLEKQKESEKDAETRWENDTLVVDCSKQKPAEWSEEDWKTLDEMREHLICVVGDKPDFTPNKIYESFINLIDKLKSLRPSWKPSEEQKEALDKAIPVCMGVVGRDEVAPLESLYEQLKKL